MRALARPRPISASPATDPPSLLPLPDSLDEVRSLRFDPLRPKDPRSRIWNEFVNHYHYLGHKNLPGAQLRYFVHARDGLPLALLAQVERCLPADWHSRYNLRPVLLETFCETPRFRGTCYRAANWLHLGHFSSIVTNGLYMVNAHSGRPSVAIENQVNARTGTAVS